MDLNLAHIVFKIQCDQGCLPVFDLYQQLRRFDGFFRRIVCSDCSFAVDDSCFLNPVCPFKMIFGQNLSADPDVVRRHQKPPLPFLFKVNSLHEQAVCVDLSLILIGPAVQLTQQFVAAVMELMDSFFVVNRLPAAVKGVYSMGIDGVSVDLAAVAAAPVLVSVNDILANVPYCESVRVSFVSPVRLFRAGSVIRVFSFSGFFRALMRRCSAMTAYYGGYNLDFDYSRLSSAVDDQVAVKTSTVAFKTYLKPFDSMCGFYGSFEVVSPSLEFVQILSLGSYLNLGKYSAYGLGNYQLVTE